MLITLATAGPIGPTPFAKKDPMLKSPHRQQLPLDRSRGDEYSVEQGVG